MEAVYKRCKECGEIRHKDNDFTSKGAPKCNDCKKIPNPHRGNPHTPNRDVIQTFNYNGDDEIYC